MSRIVIEAVIEQRDWAEYLAWVSQRTLGRSRVVATAMTFAAILVVPIVALLLFEELVGGLDFSSGLLGVVFCVMSLRLVNQIMQRRMQPSDNGAVLGPCRMEFDATGLRVTRPAQSTFTHWSAVQEIAVGSGSVYVMTDRIAAFIVPRRSVGESALVAFVEQLKRWHANPAPLPAQSATDATDATGEQSSRPWQAIVQTVPLSRAPATPPGFLPSLARNLRAGLRLVLLRRLDASDFVVSFDQLAALLSIALLAAAGLDWVTAEPDMVFDRYALFGWAYYLVAGLWGAALIARWQGKAGQTRALLVAWLAGIPWIIIVLAALYLIPLGRMSSYMPIALAAGIAIGMSERAVVTIFGGARIGTIVLIILVLIGVPFGLQRIYVDPHIWVDGSTDDTNDPQASREDAKNAESLLFDQPERIDEAVDATAEQRPALTDTYFLGFAGHGEQGVFRREALFAEDVFAKRFGTHDRSVELINDVNDRGSYPLATVTGLRYALQSLGERMNRDEDVLVLFITSHGSSDGEISVTNGRLPLVDLDATALRSALDDSGIRWRIVVVSACYAGTFVDPLKSDSTLVITAADANHNSFGCADDRDLTYFGEAFLRDSLPKARSLEAAFTQARGLIEARENEEHLTHSRPQIFIGDAMRTKLDGLMQ